MKHARRGKNFYDEYFRDLRDTVQATVITRQLLMVKNELDRSAS
jgi:hypothetical protein